MNHSAVVLTCLLIVCAGCATVGPDYVTPEVAVPDRWHQRIAKQVSQGSDAISEKWWTGFNDPVLNDLIERAGAANLDLKTASSRIR